MAKTLAGVKPEYTAEEIKKLPAEFSAALNTFELVCSIAKGEKEAGAVIANAGGIFEFSKFIDKLADISKMGKEALETAVARYSEAHDGETPDGFKWKNNGSTTKVIDTESLIHNLVVNEGRNEDTIRKAMTITVKALSEATGLTEKCLVESYPECFAVTPKKPTLQRTSN